MTEMLTYHYVREREAVRFGGLHVRSTSEFDQQLDRLDPATATTVAAAVEAVAAGADPTPGTWVVTFDDGFSDHYDVVYPRLRERGVTGAFYPPTASTLHRTLLDVHMIQLLMTSGQAVEAIKAVAIDFLTAEGRSDQIPALEPDVSQRSTGGRFDRADARALKRGLQAELDPEIRSSVVRHLFDRVIGEDAAVVANELYLDLAQLREMARGGMEIGGHSATHRHLDVLDDAELRAEIDASLELLDAVHGTRRDDLVFCYPYGSSDQRVIEAVRAAGFVAGLGVQSGTVTADSDIMLLPRFDTNDIDQLAAAAT